MVNLHVTDAEGAHTVRRKAFKTNWHAYSYIRERLEESRTLGLADRNGWSLDDFPPCIRLYDLVGRFEERFGVDYFRCWRSL